MEKLVFSLVLNDKTCKRKAGVTNTAEKLRKNGRSRKVFLENRCPLAHLLCTATWKATRAEGKELASHHPLVPSMHSANGDVEKTIHLSSPSASSRFGTLWRWDNSYRVMW